MELSIVARSPVILQASDSYQERLAVTNQSYVITDGVGFDTATFVLDGSTDYLIDWFSNGLVRDIEWTTPTGGVAFNGFVNRLQLVAGGDTYTRAVDNMYNRIILVYTALDTSTNPPTAGAQATVTKNDTLSQEKYGVKTKVVSAGECTAATADDTALKELTRHKYIVQGRNSTVGAGKVPSLKVEMHGYGHMANWYNYTQTASSGTDDADNIILLILAADPNSVLSADAYNVDTNTTAIEQYQDGKQLGWKIIQEIAKRGIDTGGVGYPWSLGVYEGRRTVYKQAEGVDDNGVAWSTNKHLALYRQLLDTGDSITDGAGREVFPWDVRPDRLIYTAGLPGRPTYIQQVKFTAPYKVTWTGTDRLFPALVKSGCS